MSEPTIIYKSQPIECSADKSENFPRAAAHSLPADFDPTASSDIGKLQEISRAAALSGLDPIGGKSQRVIRTSAAGQRAPVLPAYWLLPPKPPQCGGLLRRGQLLWSAGRGECRPSDASKPSVSQLSSPASDKTTHHDFQHCRLFSLLCKTTREGRGFTCARLSTRLGQPCDGLFLP